MKNTLQSLGICISTFLLFFPLAAHASTGNEVAIETIELYSPLEIGEWVNNGKGEGCRFTTDPGVTITVYLDQKRNFSPLLLTEPGERCVVNPETGRVLPFFMGTSMATPAVINNSGVTKTNLENSCLLEFQIPEKFKPTATTTLKSRRAELDHVGAYNFMVEISGVSACKKAHVEPVGQLKEMAE